MYVQVPCLYKVYTTAFSYRRFFASWDASSSIWTQVESFQPGHFLCAEFDAKLKKMGFQPHKIENFHGGRSPDPQVSCWTQVRTALDRAMLGSWMAFHRHRENVVVEGNGQRLHSFTLTLFLSPHTVGRVSL